MTRRLFPGLLLAVNLILIGCLLSAPKPPRADAITDANPGEQSLLPPAPQVGPDFSGKSRTRPARVAASSTPFTRMYSSEPRRFAANLRAMRCPEETVKDIIVAEISRRYKAQEKALRPKPADHVPIGWSPGTSEGKLLQRRHQATVLAREKAALVQEALGYSVPVAIPLYAMTAADLRFETQLADLPETKSKAVRQAHEDYWWKVQVLQERTKGFWQSEDVVELNRLKDERQQNIQKFRDTP